MTATTKIASADFRRRLLRWYREHGRHLLPWRETRDPYAILVSEIMLQQTQVERVIPYYRAWMARWPTLEALAAAPLPEVIRAWAGLGYNRRAVDLHRASLAAVASGGLPFDPDRLAALPGIGKYTAAAVACFSAGAAVPVLDTNVSRVIARAVLGADSPRSVAEAELQVAAARLVPQRNARDHNLAFMDLGATVCTARAPRCDVCALASLCGWRAAGYPSFSVRSSASGAPFPRTARFARGRIVDALRSAAVPCPEHELVGSLPPEHRPRLQMYLTALERDGLVETVPGGWALAGTQRTSIASPKL